MSQEPVSLIGDYVTIINPKSKYHGQCGVVVYIYYDYLHTGNSPDILHLKTEDSHTIITTSDQVTLFQPEPSQ